MITNKVQYETNFAVVTQMFRNGLYRNVVIRCIVVNYKDKCNYANHYHTSSMVMWLKYEDSLMHTCLSD